MCLQKVFKKFKGTGSKKITGYKVVRKYKNNSYGPLFIKIPLRWKKGRWYDALYNHATYYNPETGREISPHGIYSGLIKQKKIPPMIGNQRKDAYPCGIHFFNSKTDVNIALVDMKHYRYDTMNIALLKCEFKNTVATGEQWSAKCRVARKMKIIRQIKWPVPSKRRKK